MRNRDKNLIAIAAVSVLNSKYEVRNYSLFKVSKHPAAGRIWNRLPEEDADEIRQGYIGDIISQIQSGENLTDDSFIMLNSSQRVLYIRNIGFPKKSP